ncbi:MAG: F-box protein [Alphaproteobacteria bacterium]|nr:F-box protein [Alphaproteobacteria bacterium]
MKKLFSFFTLVCLGLGFITVPPCAASSNPTTDTDQEEHAVLTHLPRDLTPLIFQGLPVRDLLKASRVCKAWHHAKEEIVTQALETEAWLMLHELSGWSVRLSPTRLPTYINKIYKKNGFAFVPLRQETFPKDSRPFTNDEIKPLLPTLYAHVFREHKEALSSQDLLCLESVLPWSRVVFNPKNAAAKARALTFLQTLKQNPRLIRFSKDLICDSFKEDSHIFALTTEERIAHKTSVHALLQTHDQHSLHQSIEQTPYINPGVFYFMDGIFENKYHLILSDPQKIIHTLGRSFLFSSALHSVDFRYFPVLTTIKHSCLTGATIDRVRMNCPVLTHIGAGFASNLTVQTLNLYFPCLKELGANALSSIKAGSAALRFPALTHIRENFCYDAPHLTSVRLYMPSVLCIEKNFMKICPKLDKPGQNKRARVLKRLKENQDSQTLIKEKAPTA